MKLEKSTCVQVFKSIGDGSYTSTVRMDLTLRKYKTYEDAQNAGLDLLKKLNDVVGIVEKE